MTDTAATDEALPIRIEPASAEAVAYVLSTWGRTLEANLEAVPQPGFLRAFAPLQARMIKRSKVLTALTEDGKIGGFIVYEEPNVLHWIATRKEQRQRGIGRALLRASGLTSVVVSAWAPSLRHLGLATAPYTPFWLRSM